MSHRQRDPHGCQGKDDINKCLTNKIKVMRNSTLIAMAIAVIPSAATAADLIPEQFTIGNRAFVHPLEYVSFSFDEIGRAHV